MASLIAGMNPAAPIRSEAEAEAAAKASAISIFIGVVTALASIAWTYANPQAMQDALATAGPDAAAGAMQIALYTSGAIAAIQLVFGIIQWRSPSRWIVILFLVLLAYGVLSTAASPMLAEMVPNAPVVPTWQIVLSLAIMAVQVVLHVAGLRGINKLERFQMDAAR